MGRPMVLSHELSQGVRHGGHASLQGSSWEPPPRALSMVVVRGQQTVATGMRFEASGQEEREAAAIGRW